MFLYNLVGYMMSPVRPVIYKPRFIHCRISLKYGILGFIFVLIVIYYIGKGVNKKSNKYR